ncbi:MAG: ABC transporter permease [Spirochaetes bacterium]|nr:ABC transporter permease [Spirochaetota bacterium]
MERSIDKQSKAGFDTGAVMKVVGRMWSLLFLIVLIVVFSSRGVNLFTLKSLQNILLASIMVMLVGIGETFVIISGGIDISPMYVVGLSGVFGAILLRDLHAAGHPDTIVVIVGFVATLVISILPGFVNGLLITKLKVPPFIVTIGTMSIAEGAVLMLTRGQHISGLPALAGSFGNSYLFTHVGKKGFSFLSQPALAGGKAVGIIPIPVLILALVAFMMALLLRRTVFGRHVYAIGGNVQAARLSGIPVDRVLVKVYIMAALMYGFAGMLYVMRFCSASPTAGEPLLMSSIGAVCIGGTSLSGGTGTVGGTVIGALIIAVLQTGLVLMGVSPFWQYIATGSVIILAVFFDQFKSRFLKE